MVTEQDIEFARSNMDHALAETKAQALDYDSEYRPSGWRITPTPDYADHGSGEESYGLCPTYTDDDGRDMDGCDLCFCGTASDCLAVARAVLTQEEVDGMRYGELCGTHAPIPTEVVAQCRAELAAAGYERAFALEQDMFTAGLDPFSDYRTRILASSIFHTILWPVWSEDAEGMWEDCHGEPPVLLVRSLLPFVGQFVAAAGKILETK